MLIKCGDKKYVFTEVTSSLKKKNAKQTTLFLKLVIVRFFIMTQSCFTT